MRLKPKLKLFFAAIIFLIVDLQQAYTLQVPSFLTATPAGHFAGVSAPCPSLSEARKSATLDIVRQILGSIGSFYGFESKHYVKGNVRGAGPRRTIDESISSTARGIVLDVERNIVKSTWSKDGSGKLVYYILVRYPEEKILEMRRLSKGAKLIATDISDPNTDEIKLKVSEVNGISVVLTSADIKIHKHNRFSKLISLFVWKIPEVSEHSFSVAIGPVSVCSDSYEFRLPFPGWTVWWKRVSDYLIGAELKTAIVLRGFDELGKPISVMIDFIP